MLAMPNLVNRHRHRFIVNQIDDSIITLSYAISAAGRSWRRPFRSLWLRTFAGNKEVIDVAIALHVGVANEFTI